MSNDKTVPFRFLSFLGVPFLKTILFLHDTTLATPRGAELTIQQLIKLGQEKKYHVILDYLNNFQKTKMLLNEADVVVINSTSRCGFEIDLIKHLLESPNFNQDGRKNIEELMLAGNSKDASKKIAFTVIDKISS